MTDITPVMHDEDIFPLTVMDSVVTCPQCDVPIHCHKASYRGRILDRVYAGQCPGCSRWHFVLNLPPLKPGISVAEEREALSTRVFTMFIITNPDQSVIDNFQIELDSGDRQRLIVATLDVISWIGANKPEYVIPGWM